MQCIAIKKNDERCKNNAKNSTNYCGIHLKNENINSEIIDHSTKIDDTKDNMSWLRLFLSIALVVFFISSLIYLFMNAMFLESFFLAVSFPIATVVIVNFMDGNSKEEMFFESGYVFISVIIGIMGILLPYVIGFGVTYLILKSIYE